MLKSLSICACCWGVQGAAQGFEEPFRSFDPSRWSVADYDFSHPAFDTDWRRDKVSFGSGLQIDLTPHQGHNRFAGGSIRTHQTHHFGYYETRMKAAKGDGVVTGFFTYTGPYYGTPHDEIDVEILGKDTTKLHVAWFVNGALTNHFVPLGFDAAECVHDYGFLWEPTGLSWFVNGQEVFRHSAKDGPIPEHPGHIFANLWAADPSIASWSGTIVPGTSATAQFDHIRVVPLRYVSSNS